MSRLIDADLLRAEFTGNFHEMWHYTGIWAMIDCAPTAYDIDKVIKEFEEHYSCDVGALKMISLDKAMEIVKRGAE